MIFKKVLQFYFLYAILVEQLKVSNVYVAQLDRAHAF